MVLDLSTGVDDRFRMPATAVAMGQYSAALTTWIVPRIRRAVTNLCCRRADA
jgi:hypothetical protein